MRADAVIDASPLDELQAGPLAVRRSRQGAYVVSSTTRRFDLMLLVPLPPGRLAAVVARGPTSRPGKRRRSDHEHTQAALAALRIRLVAASRLPPSEQVDAVRRLLIAASQRVSGLDPVAPARPMPTARKSVRGGLPSLGKR